jgi:nicotinamidase-related amidase
MDSQRLQQAQQASEFIGALSERELQLAPLTWHELVKEAQPEHVALFSTDMINGFCYEGALASPRVKSIIPAVVDCFNNAYNAGVRAFVLAQDAHSAQAAEFAAYPPHCQVGTSEAQTIPELADLPFAHLFKIVPKNSLSAFMHTDLGSWLDEHRDLRTAVVVGNCTDLCVYSMAMHLRLYANAHDLHMRVIVPENAVQTYDLPIATAREIGAIPHNGDVLHWLFLYHMRLNGIEVASAIEP